MTEEIINGTAEDLFEKIYRANEDNNYVICENFEETANWFEGFLHKKCTKYIRKRYIECVCFACPEENGKSFCFGNKDGLSADYKYYVKSKLQGRYKWSIEPIAVVER